MLRPGCYRICDVDARGGEDRFSQLGNGSIFRQIRKNLTCPRGIGIGNDVPVDVEIGDLFECRLVGDGIGLVGAGNFGRILPGKQHRIVAGDCKPRGTVLISLGHALVEPAGGLVEAGIRCMLITSQRRFLVGIEGRNDARTCHIGVFGDEPN
ncbi:hypothetical protein D3C87_1708780 [compost metagenome]